MSSLRDFKVIQAAYFYNHFTPSELKSKKSRRGEIIIESGLGILTPKGWNKFCDNKNIEIKAQQGVQTELFKLG